MRTSARRGSDRPSRDWRSRWRDASDIGPSAIRSVSSRPTADARSSAPPEGPTRTDTSKPSGRSTSLRMAYARIDAELSSSHWASSTAMRTGVRAVIRRSTPATATDSVRWSGRLPDGSIRRRATSRAWRCGSGRPARTSASTSENRSVRPPRVRPCSERAGPVVRTVNPAVRAWRTAASQMVVLPMPASPSSTSPDSPLRARSTNRSTAASSVPRPTISSGTECPAV